MEKLVLSLDGRWLLKGFPGLNGEEEGAYKPEYPTDSWLQAEVPGVVHLDLMSNGVIPDPFYGVNEASVKWVEDVEWWYRKEFEAPKEILAKEVVELVFEGLDTFATIWVNGVKLGETCNMFTPWIFDVKKVLKQGVNVVAVRFKPPRIVAGKLEEKYGVLRSSYYSARPYVRKAQYSFGWDWGPSLPTSGIWRSVKLLAYDRARLGYIAALPLEVSEREARVKLTAEVYASNVFKPRVKFTIEGYGLKVEREVEEEVGSGRNDVECEVRIGKPRLWWPRGYGEPNLYEMKVQLYDGARLLDEKKTPVGIRTVKLLQKEDGKGRSFTFEINGRLVFCKGANWIPADSFLPRVSIECYRRLLELAGEAGMNMLRVWGGGIYENEEFYDLCDKLGIMVWQDFMYACAEYPEEEWFLREAEREAEEVVRRLRRHPSIVLWCGNNENQWIYGVSRDGRMKLVGLPIYERILPEVCRRLDPTRPYWPSSPYGGDNPNSPYEGDRHNWEVWSRWRDYRHYLEDEGRFISEFGWQSPPTLELLAQYIDPRDMKPQSKAFEAHEKQVEGIERLYRFLSAHYPVTEDFRRFILYCQINHGEALREAIGHWRSLMFDTSGCLIWQLNDCWPAVSWSLIDYGLNPKPAYYFVKRAFKPMNVYVKIYDGRVTVYVINETNLETDVNLRFYVTDFYGKTYYSEFRTIPIQPYTVKKALERPVNQLPLAGDRLIAAIVERKGEVVSEYVKTVEEPKHLRLPKPSLKIGVEKAGPRRFKVSVSSDTYVKALMLRLRDAVGLFDDNFFDLLPGTSKTVVVNVEEETTIEEFKRRLQVEPYPYTGCPTLEAG